MLFFTTLTPTFAEAAAEPLDVTAKARGTTSIFSSDVAFTFKSPLAEAAFLFIFVPSTFAVLSENKVFERTFALNAKPEPAATAPPSVIPFKSVS